MSDLLNKLEVLGPQQAREALRAPEPGAFVIPEPRYRVLRFAGRDTLALLHTKLTFDIKSLAVGEARWGHATDINGRVLVSATFYRSADEEVLAFGPMRDAAEVAAHFDKYVILEDVQITDLSDEYEVLRLSPSALKALSEAGFAVRGNENTSRSHVVAETRCAHRAFAQVALIHRNDAEAAYAALVPLAQALRPEDWEAYEVAVGFAAPVRDLLVGETIPLQFSDSVGVVFGKGCYLGQEVIERLYSRGSANKRLRRLSGAGAPPPAGTRFRIGRREAVQITSSVPDGDAWVGLGFVGRAHLDDAQLTVRDDAEREVSLRSEPIDEERFTTPG